MRSWLKLAVAAGVGAVAWRMAKRAWLFREGTSAEPPSVPPERKPQDRTEAPPDPVDQAIAESFPASDPPSFVAGVERA